MSINVNSLSFHQQLRRVVSADDASDDDVSDDDVSDDVSTRRLERRLTT